MPTHPLWVTRLGARLGAWVGAEQSTIARRVTCCGIGLHGGNEVEIALCPAEPGTGIVFSVRAKDAPSAAARASNATSNATSNGSASSRSKSGQDPVDISACEAAVLSSSRATSLTDGNGTTLSTVEHLLATLYALRIDNARIEVQGAEIPMMDGSALPFVGWVHSAGRVGQSVPRREFEVLRPFEIREENRWIRIEPHASLRISYAIDFEHPVIRHQSVELADVDEEIFERDIAGARTFGFEHEIESLRAAGLAIGGSFENAVVLGEDRVLNASGLRWPDEFVRHKVIDLLGDLSLLGGRIRGHVRVERGGHSLHLRLVRELIERGDLLATVDDHGDARTNRRRVSAQSLA